MKTKTVVEKKLDSIVGQHVRLVNQSSEEMVSMHVQIHVHGELEAADDDGQYYVRIGEDPAGHGSNGVSFGANNIIALFRQPSLIWLVMLRG